jgi:hypothetical protein
MRNDVAPGALRAKVACGHGGKITRLVRVDLETDRLIADTARLQRRFKKDVVASAIGAYVEAHREELDLALDHTAHRIDTAADPHERDPRTGLTRAERAELFGRLD